MKQHANHKSCSSEAAKETTTFSHFFGKLHDFQCKQSIALCLLKLWANPACISVNSIQSQYSLIVAKKYGAAFETQITKCVCVCFIKQRISESLEWHFVLVTSVATNIWLVCSTSWPTFPKISCNKAFCNDYNHSYIYIVATLIFKFKGHAAAQSDPMFEELLPTPQHKQGHSISMLEIAVPIFRLYPIQCS